jgi:cell wall-associated NlpC family hydrolase
MTTTEAVSKPDRRIHAWREDLAAEELRDQIAAPRYVEGERARVVTSILAVRREPRPAAPLETEAFFGEVIRVLDTASGWAWVQLARDSYVGYVAADALSLELIEPTHHVQALGTFVYPEPDVRSPAMLHLPLGAEITVESEAARFARLATGGFVATRHIAEQGRYARDFVDVAERFIGTPYLWGGRTRIGLDCSGLVQVALEAAGVAAPRDSDMQEAHLGEPLAVPENLEGLERGDLVFWPGHVGIMVDGVMLLHANAHHMAVAVEPLKAAAERIRRAESPISSIRRIATPSAAA